MKHIYSLFSILFAALLMAGCVNDPDIETRLLSQTRY